MKILITSPHGTIVGGTESYLDALIPALAARGHDVVHLHEYPQVAGRPPIASNAVNRICAHELGEAEAIEAAAAFAPHVVYHHGLEEPRLVAALVHRWPSVFLVHDYYGTCISGFKRFAFPEIRSCNRPLGPACLACYLPRRCGGRSPITMFRMYVRSARRIGAVRRIDRVLVTSQYMRNEYERNGVAPDRLRLIRYMAPGAPRAKGPLMHPPAYKLLFIGRLTPLKGGVLLIHAVAHASKRLGRRIELVVAGEGPDRPAIEAAARATGAAVRFEGWVGKTRRAELYAEVDAVAMPSVWPEPFGLIGLEAAYFGVPAIAFDMGGITEWLVPGVTGEVGRGDRATAEEFGEAIVRAFADPARLTRMREDAWKLSHRFTVEQHVEALEAEFSAVVDQRAAE